MGIEKFTEFDSNTLGRRLNAILANPGSARILAQDFPLLPTFYGSPRQAVSRVDGVKQAMWDDPGFVVMAVMLGEWPQTIRVSGVTTFIQSNIPGMPGYIGPGMAIWLDRLALGHQPAGTGSG